MALAGGDRRDREVRGGRDVRELGQPAGGDLADGGVVGGADREDRDLARPVVGVDEGADVGARRWCGRSPASDSEGRSEIDGKSAAEAPSGLETIAERIPVTPRDLSERTAPRRCPMIGCVATKELS
jgi:hypothetical protein